MQLLDYILSLVIWTPVVGGLLVLSTGRDERAPVARWLGLGVAVLTFALCLPLYFAFDAGSYLMQFQERVSWIPAFHAYYHLGIDGISMPLILLTSFLTIVVLISAWQVITDRVAQYIAAFLIMEGLVIGVFSALDALLFYVFWEAMLIPMFLIIGIWGGPNRIYASIKFFLYTLLGSLLMLVAILYLYFASDHSFSLLGYHDLALGLQPQILLFLAFFAAFAVKVPMWPVHTWLPDAHVEAPTGGSVILAAIMLKLGAYGFLRINLPTFPDASHALDWFMISLSLIAIVYIALVALVQEDMKKLVAYSSISHMGFVTLGFFIFNVHGMEGGLVQMISHGFISGALFLCIGVMYDRVHSRRISDYGGVANTMPVFAAFMMLFVMANSGLPGTSGFVGELLVILGAAQTNFLFALLAGSTLVLGAAYNLWLYKRVIYGKVANDNVAGLKDVNGREMLMLGMVALFVLALGLWPLPLLESIQVSVDHLLVQVSQSKLP
ncbi:MAG: NADH-quinone oxidoreductase subunit M [Gammaproteobacteria bacterium]|nr:NADH-quinone oxidoreductase subunit M [Gammaproteobacteria bacterium]